MLVQSGIAYFREIRVPRPDNLAWDSLRAAFGQVLSKGVISHANIREMRNTEIIDQAGAQVLRVPIKRCNKLEATITISSRANERICHGR